MKGQPFTLLHRHGLSIKNARKPVTVLVPFTSPLEVVHAPPSPLFQIYFKFTKPATRKLQFFT